MRDDSRKGRKEAEDAAKAIRINIREARIGQVVSSINVYLAPYDPWNQHENPNAEGHIYYGLPVVGFLATKLAADEITAGVLRNFAMLVPHAGDIGICFDCE